MSKNFHQFEYPIIFGLGVGLATKAYANINSLSLTIVLLFASTKSHASGKIKNRYFRILRKGSGVFFDADSESPHVT